MTRSPRNWPARLAGPDAIAAHAHSLERHSGGAYESQVYADVCARREIEIRDQELRSFVVRRSLLQSHFVVGFAMILAVIALLGPPRIRFGPDVLAAFITFAGFVIAGSTSSIKTAVDRHHAGHPRATNR